MEDINELQRQIETHGFGVILEVTCAISSGNTRQKKKDQLINGQRYIRQLVDSKPEIYTGLIFCHYTDPSQIADLQDDKINFLLQTPSYNVAMFKQAFEKAQNRLGSKEKQTAITLLDCIGNGEDLEGLLNSQSVLEWRSFLQRFPEIAGPEPTVSKCYEFGIEMVNGGSVLEEYARLLCQDELAEVFLYGPHNIIDYTKQIGEIDLVLVGPKEKIVQGFNNPRLFLRHHEKDVE
ncbi:MAG: hypothetical protein KAT77_02740 [Nanoarchaeota archaeon]|nr:hypothetical protein [Nanoarchaeota archaeon]